MAHDRLHRAAVLIGQAASGWAPAPWFGLLTDKLIRRSVHTSVKALKDDIRAWIDSWNENPRPFTWTKTADEILKSLADYLSKVTPRATENQQET